jgi:Sec-independent protein translocase protein TatA
MVLDALEIGIVAVMAISVFIWGPDKIPDIAKTLSTARKELNVYTKQLQGITKELESSINSGNFDNLSSVLTGAAAGPLTGASVAPNQATAVNASPALAAPEAAQVPTSGVPLRTDAPPAVKSGDQLLLEMAKQLRIQTAGKTRDEIQNEILTRAANPIEYQSSPLPPAEAPEASPPAASPPSAA